MGCTSNAQCGEGYCNLDDKKCVCTDYWWTTEENNPCAVARKSKVIAFLLQVFLGPFGIGCFYLGWWFLGLACLFLLGFGCLCIPFMLCLLQTSAQCLKSIVNCICSDCCSFLWEGKTDEEKEQIKQDYCFYCCASFLTFLGVIFWIISLVQISNDCVSDGVPCVPWH